MEYGGFMSSLCIMKGNDIFTTAIAVAPVTHYKYYDSIYTERYMRTPAENERGYEDNAPLNWADKLKGNLLICHGTADDNVHVQNTYELAERLVQATNSSTWPFTPTATTVSSEAIQPCSCTIGL